MKNDHIQHGNVLEWHLANKVSQFANWCLMALSAQTGYIMP